MNLDELKDASTAQTVWKFPCPVCNILHTDQYVARNCCARDIRPVYVCSVCDEVFLILKDCDEHIKQPHGSPLGAPTPMEEYLDRLRFGNDDLVLYLSDLEARLTKEAARV